MNVFEIDSKIDPRFRKFFNFWNSNHKLNEYLFLHENYEEDPYLGEFLKTFAPCFKIKRIIKAFPPFIPEDTVIYDVHSISGNTYLIESEAFGKTLTYRSTFTETFNKLTNFYSSYEDFFNKQKELVKELD